MSAIGVPRRPGIQSTRPIVIAVVLGAVAVAVLSGIAFVQSGPRSAVLLMLAAAAPVVLVGPVVAARRHYDMFEPLSFVLLSVLIGVTARTYLLVLDNNPALTSYLLVGRSMAVLVPGLLFINLGLLCFAAGYLVRVPRLPLQRVYALRGDLNRQRLAIVLFPIVLVSVVSVILFMRATGGWSAVLAGAVSNKRTVAVAGSAHTAALGYYHWGAGLAAYGYCCVLATIYASGFSRSRAWVALAAFLALLTALLPFLASSRTGVLLVIVLTALIVHYSRGRFTMREVFAAVLIALVGFAVMGVLRAKARNVVQRQAIGFTGALEETIGTRHWLGADKTSLIIQAVPNRLPYQHGATLYTWIFAPVPRTIWPAKPLINTGPIIGQVIYGLNEETTGVPPGMVAEFYWNFGALGVPIGMFLLGVLFRFLYRSLQPLLAEARPGAIVAYTACIAPMALQLPGGDVSGGVIMFLTSTITTAFVLVFVVPKPRQRWTPRVARR